MAYNPYDLAFSNEAAQRLSAATKPLTDALSSLFSDNAASLRSDLTSQFVAPWQQFSQSQNPHDLIRALGMSVGLPDPRHPAQIAIALGMSAPAPESRAVTIAGHRTLPRGYMGPRPTPIETVDPLALGLGPAWDRSPGIQTGEGLPPSIAAPAADPNVRYIPQHIDPQTGFPTRGLEADKFRFDLRAGKYNDIFSPEELTALSQQLEPGSLPPRPNPQTDVPIPNERPLPRPDDLFGTSEDRPALHELELGTAYATYRKRGIDALRSIQRDLEAGKISPAMASARAKTIHEGLNELPTAQATEATRQTFPVEWRRTAPSEEHPQGQLYPNFNPIGSHTLSSPEMASRGWNPPPDATAKGSTRSFLLKKGMLATQNTDPNYPRNFRVYEPRANASRYFDRPLDLDFPETQQRIQKAGGFRNMLQLDQPVPAQFGPALLDIRGPSGERVLVGQKIDIATAPSSRVASALGLTPEGLRAKLGLAGIIARAPSGRRYAKFSIFPTK